MLQRPDVSEYDPFYSTYVDKVPEGDILSVLEASAEQTLALLECCGETQASFRYAPGKWSISELIGHVIDTERLFAFRALHFARQDPSALPGMDQDVWAASSNASGRSLSSLATELATVRAATLSLFSSFDERIVATTGVASGCRFTVNALAYVIAGHEIHHRGVLEERYILEPD